MLNEIQRKAQEQFDRQSHRYGRGHILENTSDVEAALQRIALPESASVLDVATGGGHTGLLLASRGHRVILADLSHSMLERAGVKAKERGLTVELKQHAAEEFPYPSGSFDLVSCRVAAHHFSDPIAFVRETARVLKPGGSFLLIDGSFPDGEPEAEEWIHQVEKFRDPSHHRFLAPARWSEICQAEGLSVEYSALDPLLQPDLEWYFETAATSPENRKAVLDLVAKIPASARRVFQLKESEGKITWVWSRLTLIAKR